MPLMVNGVAITEMPAGDLRAFLCLLHQEFHASPEWQRDALGESYDSVFSIVTAELRTRTLH